MSGRPKIFNEEEVIQKAIEVFWRNGYEASSTEQLLTAMGIGKSSFYLAFKGGKRELFERAMEQRSRQGIERLEKGFAEASDKVTHLKSLFLNIADARSDRHLNGCMLGNSIAELSNIDAELKSKASELLMRLEQIFLNVLTDAKADGTLTSTEQPEILARHLLTIWNGLNISVRMYPNPDVLKPLIEKQLEILD